MSLLDLIPKEAPAVRRRLVLVASLAGLSNAAIMASVNAAAQSAGSLSTRHFVLFALSILLFIASSRYTFHQTANVIEKTLYNIKTRVIDKLTRVEVEGLEQIGSNEIYDRLTENVTIISSSVNIIAFTLESLLVVVFASAYVALISMTAFITLVVINGFAAGIYYAKQGQVKGYLQDAAQERMSFIGTLSDLLSGFKQLKLSSQRVREVKADIEGIAGNLRSSAVNAHVVFGDNLLIGNSNLFILLGGIAFLLPQYDASATPSVPKIIGAVLFTWGPLQSVIAGIPNFLRAGVALANISELEEKLERSVDLEPDEEELQDPWHGRFAKIELRQIEFRYKQDEESFHVGPLTLTIPAGEVLFIVGGNGSGKSTLIKLLAGLYRPISGEIYVDGTLLNRQNRQAYREMISIVLTDFHLFRRLYGISSERHTEVLPLLQRMQLAHKTAFAKGRFTKVDLSTGQRKRLALVVSLLEDRPLYVFDELAADQDPEFRKYFYLELLPELKRRGKTIIVISHDDRYFSAGDRVVTMEYGQIRTIRGGTEAGSLPS